MASLANDLRELGQPVVAGFSTHPHWDHLLWDARLGAAYVHALRDAHILSNPGCAGSRGRGHSRVGKDPVSVASRMGIGVGVWTIWSRRKPAVAKSASNSFAVRSLPEPITSMVRSTILLTCG
jgi:hypothetical protein